MSESAAEPGGVAALVPGSIANHASCLLLKLGQAAFRLQEAQLASLDLRVRHFSVLQGLADEGPIGQVDLGRYLRMDPATMTAALDHLQARGAVVRERDVADRRRYVVDLTASGRDLLAEVQGKLDGVDALLATDIGAGALEALREALLGLAVSPALLASLETASTD